MNKKLIIADNSFYVCFLDDIQKPEILTKLSSHFSFKISPTIKKELKQSKNYHYIANNGSFEEFKSELQLGEALKPFFTVDQIKKGESEIIVIAYTLYNCDVDFILIVDEGQARKFIESQMPYLTSCMTGTANFVGECYCTFKIFLKKETISLLDEIDNSKFRIKKEIIKQIKQRVEVN